MTITLETLREKYEHWHDLEGGYYASKWEAYQAGAEADCVDLQSQHAAFRKILAEVVIPLEAIWMVYGHPDDLEFSTETREEIKNSINCARTFLFDGRYPLE